jgi:thiaminase/transcriptional activator TenA
MPMSLSQILWQDNQDIALACLRHPFVQGIADGTLATSKFAYYIGQDAFFLEAFARAYSIAAAKALDWQTFQIFHRLATGVLEELSLHQSLAKSWGVDLERVSPGAATRHYTDFLLSTAWSHSPGPTSVAMSPCMRLYAFLGQSLALGGIPNHAYRQWIATYSSNDFEPLAKQLETLVNQQATDTPLIRANYQYAMECELRFFEAAWHHP